MCLKRCFQTIIIYNIAIILLHLSVIRLLLYLSFLVIIICLDNNQDQLKFLRMAHSKGMRAPDYVFFRYRHYPEPITYEPWVNLDNQSPNMVKDWQKVLFEINYKQVQSSKTHLYMFIPKIISTCIEFTFKQKSY